MYYKYKYKLLIGSISKLGVLNLRILVLFSIFLLNLASLLWMEALDDC
jgi:hypothetical protein